MNTSPKDRVAKFVTALYRLYVDLFFTYLEINPLVVTEDKIYILDLAAKVTLVYKIQGLQWSRSSPVSGHTVSKLEPVPKS